LERKIFASLVKQASEKYEQSILFGYAPEKVLERRGQLLLMAAGRNNEEKYYQLAGESYQQAFKYPSCMRIITELFERANKEQGNVYQLSRGFFFFTHFNIDRRTTPKHPQTVTLLSSLATTVC